MVELTHVIALEQARRTRTAWLLAAVFIAMFTLCAWVPAMAADYGKPLRFPPPPVDLGEQTGTGPEAQSEPPQGGDVSVEDAACEPKEKDSSALESATPENSGAGGAVPNTARTVSESGEGAKNTTASKPKPINLFGYVEFRGQIKNMPKWERVLNAEKKDSSFSGNLNAALTPAVAGRWLKVREKVKNAPLMEQVKAVNNFFNQWPYKTDIVNWKIEDYWATPREFVRKSGDCEDYAIAKYYALRDLGVPACKLRVIAVIDRIRGIGHAVLVVFANDNAYILDNLTNLVLVHSRLTNYEPKFSVNEEFRWAHIKPISKPK